MRSIHGTADKPGSANSTGEGKAPSLTDPNEILLGGAREQLLSLLAVTHPSE
jgi:hypothetical protein